MTIIITILISVVSAQTIKVAVLDTGFNYEHINKIPTCIKYDKSINDDNERKHGTNIVGLIQKHAGKVKYCFYLYKIWSKTDPQASNRAIIDAINNGVHIINYSGGGKSFDSLEATLVKQFLNKGGVFIAASGNNSDRLQPLNCNYYPACIDPRIVVIGNKAKSSNYGTVVDVVLDGNNQEAYRVKLSGSSQATAIYTGMFLNFIFENTKVFKKTTDK